jgi:hypothetical protein
VATSASEFADRAAAFRIHDQSRIRVLQHQGAVITYCSS